MTWDDFALAVRTDDTALRKATPAALDAAEKRHGLIFPASYRGFASAYGAGDLIHRVGRREVRLLITTPRGRGQRYLGRIGLDDLNRPMGRLRQGSVAPAGAPRLVCFARDEATQDLFGWAIDEATDTGNHKYVIHRRRADGTDASPIARTFADFLLVYWLGETLAAWDEAGRASDEDRSPKTRAVPPIRFTPDSDNRNFLEAKPPKGEFQSERDDFEDLDGVEVETIQLLKDRPRRYRDQGMWVFEWETCDRNGEFESEEFFAVETPGELVRIQRFWDACQAIPFDGVQVHEVPYTEYRERQTPIPAAQAVTDPAPIRREFEFTTAGWVRRVPHPPAPVAESWRRIVAWAAEHCPEILAQFQPGSTAKDLDRFESAIGSKLPPDVRDWFRIQDGFGLIPSDWRGDEIEVDGQQVLTPTKAVKSRPAVTCLFYDFSPASIQKSRHRTWIYRYWKFYAETADVLHEAIEPLGIDYDYESFPAGAVRMRDSCRGWIPLANSGEQHFLAIDLDPGPTGVAGQVINFGRSYGMKYVLANSWGQFLEDFADELEAGNFLLGLEECSYFYPKRPECPPLGLGFDRHFQSWAEAKLPPEFQLAKRPPALTELDDPTVERECRAVVEDFISRHHAWATRWLAARPVGEMGFSSISESPDGQFSAHPLPREHYQKTRRRPPENWKLTHSRAWGDPVKRARYFAQFHLAGQHRRATSELRKIYARCTTAKARRIEHRRFLYFRLDHEPEYDPRYDRPVKFLRHDAQTVVVALERQKLRATYRMILKHEGGEWRIDYMQYAFEDGRYVRDCGV